MPCETKPQLEISHTWTFEGFELSAVTLASLVSLCAGKGTCISYKSGTSRLLIMLVFRQFSKCMEGLPSTQYRPRLDEDLFVFFAFIETSQWIIEDLLTPALRPPWLIYYGTSRRSKTSSNLQPPDLWTARRPLRLEFYHSGISQSDTTGIYDVILITKWERPRSLYHLGGSPHCSSQTSK